MLTVVEHASGTPDPAFSPELTVDDANSSQMLIQSGIEQLGHSCTSLAGGDAR
jgi:hypothetical protein